MATEIKMCEACGEKEALVGYGIPPKWLCQECFRGALAAVRWMFIGSLLGKRK